MIMKRILFLNTCLLFFLIGCSERNEVTGQRFEGQALGTSYMVKYFSEEDLDFQRSMDSIIEQINLSMSTYISESDISKINHGNTEVEVDENFQKVFRASEKIYKESKGFFDPTVGVLVNAYGFGPGEKLREIDTIKLDSLKQLVGFDKLSLNPDNTISKADPDVYLDFNAIAKGYAIDVVGQYLESKGVNNYLIELGGELRARGKNLASDSEWVVGIDDPMQTAGDRQLYARLNLTNSSMATSGNYRKYRVDSISGRQYVHTINPLTGKAERSNLLSASVLTETCMMADGYATAFMALGLDGAKKLLKELKEVEAYLIYSDENAQIKVYATKGFENQLIN